MNDDASETYVSMRQRACTAVGIKCTHIEIDPNASEAELVGRITELNEDLSVHGILVQIPVPTMSTNGRSRGRLIR